MELGLFIFRCIRCTALFCLRWRDERYGEQRQWDALETNPCRVCGKGSVEYIGIVHYAVEDKDAEPK